VLQVANRLIRLFTARNTEPSGEPTRRQGFNSMHEMSTPFLFIHADADKTCGSNEDETRMILCFSLKDFTALFRFRNSSTSRFANSLRVSAMYV